jgi:hypothetical protein
MTDPNRYKRPDLERSQPVRSFRGVFGPPSTPQTPAAAGGVDTAAAAPNGSEPRQPGVPLGVDLGYRVIEEYMQQGQAFARAVFPSGAPAGLPDPRKLNERIFKYASDLAAAWLEYVQTLSGSGAMAWPTPGTPAAPGSAQPAAADGGNAFDVTRRAPSGQLGPFDMPGPTNGHASTPVNGHGTPPPARAPAAAAPAHGDAREAAHQPFALAIDLASKKRAEVTLELKPGAPTALSAHELRAADPNLPRIGPVVIEVQPDQQRVVVRICVPDTQPAAIYNALILDDATNLPRGTLTVRIAD